MLCVLRLAACVGVSLTVCVGVCIIPISAMEEMEEERDINRK